MDTTAGYLRFVERRAVWVIVGGLVLAAAGGLLAGRVRVEPRLEALLPEGTGTLRAIQEMRRRIPSSSPLFLLVSSEDPKLNRQLVVQIHRRVSRWPETRHAMIRRDPKYFLDRRMLFLRAEQLDELADRVEDEVQWRQCEAIPGCVNLDDQPEPISENTVLRYFDDVPEVRALLGIVGIDAIPRPSKENDRRITSHSDPTSWGELCSKDGTVCTVQVVLDGSSSDLEYAERMLAKAEAVLAEVRPADAPATLKLATSGDYRNAPMIKRLVVSDLARTGALSLALVVAVLLLQFRGPRAFGLLLIPLVFAGLWTVGVIALINPTLNILSAFTLVVLAGLGIDFGVHLLTHYGEERRKGEGPSEALCTSFRLLRGPMAIAGATTACGFGALAAASFRGFAQMGVLAAIGVALAVVAYVTIFPALVLLAHRFFPERANPIRDWPTPRVGPRRRPRLWAGAVCLGGVGLAIASAAIGSSAQFEYNFRNLRPSVVGHGIRWGRSLHGSNRSAVVMMADDATQLEDAARALREIGPGDLARADAPWVMTPSSFVPHDQKARLLALGRLREAVQEAKRFADPAGKATFEEWEPLLDVREPIRADRLPPWVDPWVRERDGRFGTFGLLYTDLSGADARQMERLAKRIDGWRERFPEIRFASGSALIGTVVPGLRKDAPWMLGLAVGGLFLGTVLIGRSFRRALVVLAPLAIAACFTLGLMVLGDVRINLYNMLIFPLAFGIGVDGAIYMAWTLERRGSPSTEGGVARDHAWWTTARGILGSTLTTAVAFGSMMIARNPGLVSLGALALIALGSVLVANLVWLPAATVTAFASPGRLEVGDQG